MIILAINPSGTMSAPEPNSSSSDAITTWGAIKPKAKAAMDAANKAYTSSSQLSSPIFNSIVIGACVCYAVKNGGFTDIICAITCPFGYAGYQMMNNIEHIGNFASKLFRG